MKILRKLLFSVLAICLLHYMCLAQNPNWTLPGGQYNPNVVYAPLPQSPMHPVLNVPETDPDLAYTGLPSTNTHAGYTGPDGELLFFTIDDKLYDKNGWVVGVFERNGNPKKGYSERLILPMGNDCRKFAILFSSSLAANEIFTGHLSQQRLFMAIYDLDAENTYNFGSGVTGELLGGAGTTLQDISFRDGPQYNTIDNNFYGFDFFNDFQAYNSNIQLAATSIINNSYFLVFVFDGKHLLRYRLTSNDLEWDNYFIEVPIAGFGSELRTEMELVKTSDGNYRIAIPSDPNGQNVGISIYGLDECGEEIPNSYQFFNLGSGGPGGATNEAEMHGLEFDPTGRYLYFTHRANSVFPNALDVWDVNTSSFVNLPASVIASILPFRQSFIESFGGNLFVVKDNVIGRLTNVSNPANQLAFNPTFQPVVSGYGNNPGGLNQFRYILPEQLDMPYADLSTFSCECCSLFPRSKEDQLVAPVGTTTWNSGTFGTSEIYITDELRVPAGSSLIIDGLTFYFGPNARVIVERGNSTTISGGFLRLMNGSKFTADGGCDPPIQPIVNCSIVLPGPESIVSEGGSASPPCDGRKLWQGVRVEGQANYHVQTITTSSRHGRFFMSAGTTVEFAKIGVLAGHESLAGYGGGYLNIQGATLKDNVIGVQFDTFQRYSGPTSGSILFNLANISLNTFETTNAWLSLDEVAVYPKYFVYVVQSSGLRLSGNTFINEVPTLFSTVQQGIGIRSELSRIENTWGCSGTSLPCSAASVVQSSFSNLQYGIYALAANDNTLHTFACNYSDFDDCYIGIYLNNFKAPRVLDNDFQIRSASQATGLVLASNYNYVVEGNNFTTVGGGASANNVGINVSGSGTQANEIYRNTFSALRLGILGTSVNAAPFPHLTGLEFRCNLFNPPITGADIAIYSGPIAAMQGTCQNPAGNRFSHSSTLFSTHLDFSVCCGANSNVQYRHHDVALSGLPNLVPLVYSSTAITLNSCNGTKFGKGSCRQVNSGTIGIGDTQMIVESGGQNESTDEESSEDLFEPWAIQSFDEVYAAAENLRVAKLEMEAALNWQQAEQALALISSENGSSDAILDSIENWYGSAMPYTVYQALVSGNNADESAELLEPVVLGDMEAAYIDHTRSMDSFWQDVAVQVFHDTAQTISADQFVTLLDQFEPRNMQRLRATFPNASGLNWIEDDNALVFGNETNALSWIDTTGGYPSDLSYLYESGYFDIHQNVHDVNKLYQDAHAMIDPYFPDIEWSSDDTGSKSNSSNRPNANQIQAFDLFPNPFTDQLQLRVLDANKYAEIRVVIHDVVGRLVYEGRMASSPQMLLETEDLPQGMLIYSIYTDGVFQQSGKVLKSK